MTRYRLESEPAWIGQVYYFNDDNFWLDLFSEETIKDSKLLSRFVKQSVTADVDSAQRFLFQNLWYNGSLRMAGFVGGVGAVSMDEPRPGFGGAAYFTDGFRLVVFVSEDALALDDGRFIYDTRQRLNIQGMGQ